MLHDEGFTEEDSLASCRTLDFFSAMNSGSVQECEELAYQLLASLPRARLATIQRRLAPLLQFDVVGTLPAEVSLQIFSHLSHQSLLTCGLVSHRWHSLANDQSVWKNLCSARGWAWRQPVPLRAHVFHASASEIDSDDEGMGDSDEDEDEEELSGVQAAKRELTLMQAELDSGFASMSLLSDLSALSIAGPSTPKPKRATVFHSAATARPHQRHSAPSVLKNLGPSSVVKPNYKLLYQTHIRLQHRYASASYKLSALQTRGDPTNAHSNTIYCVQLYTYPATGVQVLFTGSRDKTVREWNLTTGMVERVIKGVHASSVLSICVHNGMLASAGSDRRVAVWDLEKNKCVKVISDHEDSVLCVRFDDERLVSCSKDRTVRTYTFPDLRPQFVLGAHRAAVNAVSLSPTLIVSGSGDRSIRLWDAKTGKLLRTFENHHSRGIASIDFRPPYVLSGSSDKHLRVFDITNLQGWTTSPDSQSSSNPPSVNAALPFNFAAQPGNVISVPAATDLVCQACGSHVHAPSAAGPTAEVNSRCIHSDLVRSVALGDEFVVSGSYDLSIKVWDRKSGALVADLTNGHTGRIFCIGFDHTKIVSCGEDQRICIWDFSHGIDTSFLQL